MTRVNLPGLVSLVLITHCATVAPQTVRSQIPATLMDAFIDCSNIEGGGRMVVEVDGSSVLSADFDWVGKKVGVFDFEFIDPVGRTFATLKSDGVTVAVVPNSVSGIADLAIAVDSNGFLYINQQFTPMKVAEIPCLLSGKMPSVWLEKSGFVDRSETQITIEIPEQDRLIAISFANVQFPPAEKVCARFQWSSWILFSHEFVWCHAYGAKAQSDLLAPRNVHLRWNEAGS